MYIIKLVTSRCVVLRNSNPLVAMRLSLSEEANACSEAKYNSSYVKLQIIRYVVFFIVSFLFVLFCTKFISKSIWAVDRSHLLVTTRDMWVWKVSAIFQWHLILTCDFFFKRVLFPLLTLLFLRCLFCLCVLRVKFVKIGFRLVMHLLCPTENSKLLDTEKSWTLSAITDYFLTATAALPMMV